MSEELTREQLRSRTDVFRAQEALRELTEDDYDKEEQIIRQVAVATETPVEYSWFDEIMDMKSLELRTFNASAPLLFNHNRADQIGVVEPGTAKVVDGVLRADIRFSKNNPKAREIFQDCIDKIRTHLSVGARIGEFVDEDTAEKDIVRLVDCVPYEVSVVPIGADPNAGIDRAYNLPTPRNIDNLPTKGEEGMSESKTTERAFNYPYAVKRAKENGFDIEVVERWEEKNLTDLEVAEDVTRLLREARKAEEAKRDEEERKRKAEEEADQEVKRSKGKTRKIDKEPETLESIAARASMADALTFAIERHKQTSYEPDGAYGEYCTELTRRGFKARNEGVPMAVVQAPRIKRAFTGAAATGGALVQPSLDSYVDPSLRYASLLDKLGVSRRSLDAGKENLPYVSGIAAVTYQPADNLDNIAETQPAISTVPVEPHTASALVRISRTLIKTSDVVDPLALTQDEIARAFEEKATTVLFNGASGSNEPVGLDNLTGVNAQTIGTAGEPSFAEMLTSYTTVISALRDIGRITSFHYVVTAAIWAHLRSTFQTAGDSTKIAQAGDGRADAYFEGNPVHILESLPTNGFYAGDFSKMEYITWGDMEVRVDDLTPGGGGVDFRFFVDNDFGVRRSNAFVEGSRA